MSKWTTENFLTYDAENPHIYALFEIFALQIAKRRKHFSAKCIFHRIRWESAVGEVNGDYKIDDGWISHYARKFVANHPQYADLFTFRLRSDSHHLNTGVKK